VAGAYGVSGEVGDRRRRNAAVVGFGLGGGRLVAAGSGC
jgi:hypothetical protein